MRSVHLVAIILALVGCGSVAPLPEEVFIRLKLPTIETATNAEAWTDGELRVAAVNANGLYRERAVAYSRDGGATLKLHRYLFWLDAPAAMVQQTLIEFLDDRRVAAHVVTTASTATELEVAAALDQYEQLVVDGNTSMKVEITFQLRTKPGRSVLTKTYSALESVTDSSPTAMAEAMGRAIAKVYTEFANEATVVLHPLSVSE